MKYIDTIYGGSMCMYVSGDGLTCGDELLLGVGVIGHHTATEAWGTSFDRHEAS
jgi:hypothetical protein